MECETFRFFFQVNKHNRKPRQRTNQSIITNAVAPTVLKFLIMHNEIISIRTHWSSTLLPIDTSTYRAEGTFITTLQRHSQQHQTIFRRKPSTGLEAFSISDSQTTKITFKLILQLISQVNLRTRHHLDR
jgi:hypothetical protein